MDDARIERDSRGEQLTVCAAAVPTGRQDTQGCELSTTTGHHRIAKLQAGIGLVGPRGLEPRTSPLSGVRSHHLS